jgi:glycosyltransferase involved in cell wall biosynthesis
MKVLLHAPSARIGGALNYITEVAPRLAAAAPDCEFLALLPSSASRIPTTPNFRVIPVEHSGALGRVWYDQAILRKLLKSEKVDVLFSTANTGMLAPPCRQVLLVRNSLYFSRIYRERMLPLKGIEIRVSHVFRRRLVEWSIHSADIVMTPSQSMMDEVRREVQFPESRAMVNHYGVDLRRFRAKVPRGRNGCPKLLFTGLYSEHKNLGTLFDALIELERAGIAACLVTPADPEWEASSNPIRDQDVKRVHILKADHRIHLTGILPGGAAIADLYQDSDIFVYPCVVESFGHPLLEAIASGLPVVAADTPVNRELCGNAALYFSPFDPQDCARQIACILHDQDLREQLRCLGAQQATAFQWDNHVRNLLSAFGIAARPEVSV